MDNEKVYIETTESRISLHKSIESLMDLEPVFITIREKGGAEQVKKLSIGFIKSVVQYLLNEILPKTSLNKTQLALRLGVSKQLLTEWSKGRAIPSAEICMMLFFEMVYITNKENIKIDKVDISKYKDNYK